MKLIMCLDNDYGISFGGKRQSCDRILIVNILELIADSTLCMTEYTKKIFPDDERIKVIRAHEPIGDCDYYFCEALIPPIDMASELYLFFWNRDYPSDIFIDKHDIEERFELKEELDFIGHSHDKITLKKYIAR